MKNSTTTLLILLLLCAGSCRSLKKTRSKTDSTVTRTYENTGEWERETIREYVADDTDLDLPGIPAYLSTLIPDSGKLPVISAVVKHFSAKKAVKPSAGKWKIKETIREKGKVTEQSKEKKSVQSVQKVKQKESGLARSGWMLWAMLAGILIVVILLFFRFRDNKLNNN